MPENEALTGPDFEVGIAAIDLPEGAPVLGHVRGEAVVLVRKGEEVRATGDALGAPALNPVACYEVQRRDGGAKTSVRQ